VLSVRAPPASVDNVSPDEGILYSDTVKEEVINRTNILIDDYMSGQSKGYSSSPHSKYIRN
jgi:hypothetical protein